MKPATPAPAYAAIFASLCEVARAHGYALAVHGSLAADMDVVACPWTEEAVDAETLARALYQRVRWISHDASFPCQHTDKPHGRRAWFFPLLATEDNARAGIDLSIMPRGGGR